MTSLLSPLPKFSSTFLPPSLPAAGKGQASPHATSPVPSVKLWMKRKKGPSCFPARSPLNLGTIRKFGFWVQYCSYAVLSLYRVLPPFLSAMSAGHRALGPTWNSRCQLPRCAVWQVDDCRSSFINNHFVLIPQTALNEVKEWTFMSTKRWHFTLWCWTTRNHWCCISENSAESTVSALGLMLLMLPNSYLSNKFPIYYFFILF